MEELRQGWNEAAHGHLRKAKVRAVNCRQCGGEFEKRSRGRIRASKYCSQQCQRDALRKRAKERAERRPRECPGCGVTFVARQWTGNSWQKWCSPRCWYLFKETQRWVDVECAQCGRAVQKLRAQIRRNTRSFCNVECRTIYHRGAQHVQYRGTPAPAGGEWKRIARDIRHRDKHVCRRCGTAWTEHDRLFPVDHIYPRRSVIDQKAANSPINLVTVCHSCHANKTAVAEAAWLRGDVLAFEQYKRSVLTLEQGIELRALILSQMTT